jgi:hypothetical protein
MTRLSRSKTLFCVSVILLAASGVLGDSRKTTASGPKPAQIVVTVRDTAKGLLFEVQSNEYKKRDANYALAEVKLHDGGNCQIIAVVDDRAPLSAITEVSEMAINAGFKDIRPFIYWHKTGRMAQVQFGPPIKFSMNAEKIEQRLAKEK